MLVSQNAQLNCLASVLYRKCTGEIPRARTRAKVVISCSTFSNADHCSALSSTVVWAELIINATCRERYYTTITQLRRMRHNAVDTSKKQC